MRLTDTFIFLFFFCFFFNDTATTEIYTLSLHDALPISILFSDVVGFTNICSAISPMQVVTMLNSMYTSFDTLIEKHNLYKVDLQAPSNLS